MRLQPVGRRALILHYPPELEEAIGAAWKKWIIGSMAVEEPENPSLPRAPRRRRTLIAVGKTYETYEDIPEWLLPR